MKERILAGSPRPGQADGASPASICILRLSAIGDVVQVVPTVRALQDRFPSASITWIVGHREAEVVGDLDGIDVLPFDKNGGFDALRRLKRALRGRRFDVLLHLHPSMRANLASLAVRADRRIGYDRARSSDGQRFFVNERISPGSKRHVLETFLSFARHLGADGTTPRWEIPISKRDRAFARKHLPGDGPVMVLSPCSSRPVRDWSADGYAEVARHAIDRHGMRIALCGGPGDRERAMGRAIEASLGRSTTNLIGRDTLKQLLAILERATVLISPDSGPAHMAAAVGTPVVGLFAATDPSRSGPYGSLEWCVNRFDAAARSFHGRSGAELPWRTKIEEPGVMDLIDPPAVIERLDALLDARGAPGSETGQSESGSPAPDP